ncbi:hypothetical protein AVEN_13850-1 [Araneus ventricosus]|uniref:Uncharacterized protein n=1 Tax=Araneus ventricosus TaxID=182803 RepID=A0A4Y2NTD5_ARAVE|nr:hypothetical protein AVEN_13850-1 [Araneus ventricosus]
MDGHRTSVQDANNTPLGLIKGQAAFTRARSRETTNWKSKFRGQSTWTSECLGGNNAFPGKEIAPQFNSKHAATRLLKTRAVL